MKTRREQIEENIERALYAAARIGLPITDPDLIPLEILKLPRFKAVLRKENGSCEALSRLLADTIDSLDEDNFPDWTFHNSFHEVPELLKRYFGLTPETMGLDFFTRLERARYPVDDRYPKQRLAIEDIKGYAIPQMAILLADDSGEAGLPEVEELAAALVFIVKKGLPLTKAQASPVLLAFLPAVAYPETESDRVARMNAYLCEQLEAFETEELRQEARIYFAVAPGTRGTSVKTREERIVTTSFKSWETVRHGMRARIMNSFAWQLYRRKSEELGRPT